MVFAQSPPLQGNWKEMLAGPAKPADYPAWHNRMVKWRQKAKDSLKYKDDKYQ